MKISSKGSSQPRGLLGKINSAFYFKPFKNEGAWAAFSVKKENFSFRHGKHSQVIISRRNFLNSLGLDYRDLVCLKQIHSSNVVYADVKACGRGADSYDSSLARADAVFTDKKNLAIAIFIADCLAVYFFDFKKKIIGLAHAGWRPSAAKVSIKLIKALKARFNSKPSDLLVGFSPRIDSCCYEIGPDVAKFFKHSVIKRQGKLFLDLIKENKRQILSQGVKENNIFDSQICTSCENDRFFSFRKDGQKAGRTMAVMALL